MKHAAERYIKTETFSCCLVRKLLPIFIKEVAWVFTSTNPYSRVVRVSERESVRTTAKC